MGKATKMRSAHLMELSVLALVSCATVRGSFVDGGGLDRASFEMRCPKEDLQVVELDKPLDEEEYVAALAGKHVGVEGCNKRVVYVRMGRAWMAETANNDITLTLPREAERATVPPPSPADRDLSICGQDFSRVDELADWWAGLRPKRPPTAKIPDRSSFLAACGSLPEDVQLCFNRSFEPAHRDACHKKVAGLSRRQREAIDELFVASDEGAKVD